MGYIYTRESFLACWKVQLYGEAHTFISDNPRPRALSPGFPPVPSTSWPPWSDFAPLRAGRGDPMCVATSLGAPARTRVSPPFFPTFLVSPSSASCHLPPQACFVTGVRHSGTIFLFVASGMVLTSQSGQVLTGPSSELLDRSDDIRMSGHSLPHSIPALAPWALC